MKQLQVTTRNGNPSQLSEMESVAAGTAKQVYFFRPSYDSDGNEILPDLPDASR